MRLLVLLLAILCACVPARPPTAPVAASHAEDAESLVENTVALVTTNDEGKTRAFCTGVWVSSSLILTAAHCVEDEYVVEYVVRSDIYASGSVSERAKISHRVALIHARDESHDLALLRAVTPPAHVVAALSKNPIRPGDVAQAMGHSLGLFYSYSRGEVAAIRSKDLDLGAEVTWIQATVPISPGNSGGGLFAADGTLIGITSATFTRGQLLNIFIHRTHLESFLARA